MSGTQSQHAEASLPLEEIPQHEQSIAKAASIIGLGLTALSTLCSLVLIFRSGFTPLTYWAMFLTLYGLCIWYANYRDVPRD